MTLPQITQCIIEEACTRWQPVEQNRLILLTGLPYSGKSTVATLFEQRNYVHIWATVIKKRFGLSDVEMLIVAEELCRQLLGRGYNVVFDFLNHTRDLRNRFRHIAEQLSVPCVIVYLDPPQEVIQTRQQFHMGGIETEGRTKIPWEVVETIRSEFQVPKAEGRIVRISGETNIEVLVHAIKEN